MPPQATPPNIGIGTHEPMAQTPIVFQLSPGTRRSTVRANASPWVTVRRATAIFCLAASGLMGCKDLAVSSANLDALLDSNDHLRHMANVRSGISYYMGTLIDPRWFGEKSFLWQNREVPVADPAYVALKNLLVLADGKGGREAHKHAVQVRQFTRFALRSPGALVRERAVLELSGHANRLGLTDLAPLLTQDTQVDLANGAELSALLAGMIDTFEPVVRKGSQASETEREDFQLACAQVQEERLELDGLWRLLRGLETFAARVDMERDLYAPMLDLSERLQRQSVLLALAGSCLDPSPRVRAANLTAQYDAFGEAVLAEALLRLRRQGTGGDANAPDMRFNLQSASIAENETLRVLFQLMEANGWPQRQNLTILEARQNRFEDLRSLLTIVNESALFDSRTRAGAMRALGQLAPEGPGGIREDSWIEWWHGWSLQEITQLKALQTGQGASTTP